MTEQQNTGCKTADETIERARKRGLTVEVKTDVRDDSTVVRVEFGVPVPEYAKGNHLGQTIAADRVAVAWYKGAAKGSRWSMLTATRYMLADSWKLRRVKDVHASLAGLGRDVELYAQEQQQRDAAAVVAEQRPEPVSAPVSAEQPSGAPVVPVDAAGPCEGAGGVPTVLVGEEERTAAAAERLVPQGERLEVRTVRGHDVRESVEERAFVVGVVAGILRARASWSVSVRELVLRSDGEATLVRAMGRGVVPLGG